MKKVFLIAAFALCSLSISAQDGETPSPTGDPCSAYADAATNVEAVHDGYESSAHMPDIAYYIAYSYYYGACQVSDGIPDMPIFIEV